MTLSASDDGGEPGAPSAPPADSAVRHPHENRPIRVLFVNRMACMERGGGETFDLEMSKALRGLGAEVGLVSGGPLTGRIPRPVEGATVVRSPWLKWFPWDKVKGGWRVREGEFEFWQRRAAGAVARLADAYDVIQICELPSLVWRLRKKGINMPIVMRMTAPNYYDPRGAVGMASALMASGMSIAAMKKRGLDVHDIPNAVDVTHFSPADASQKAAARQRLGIPPDAFVAIYAARLQGFKNHAMLLNAWRKFVTARPGRHAVLLLAGQGPLESPLRQAAADLTANGSVRFLGEVPFSDLPATYGAADLGVISSDYESFCFAAIEMMACGLPVLTTDCGWVPRLVADGAGRIVPVGDADAFAAALAEMAADPATLARLGATGRRLAIERHTWEASARKLLALYRSLLA